jgi:hypothetical protein
MCTPGAPFEAPDTFRNVLRNVLLEFAFPRCSVNCARLEPCTSVCSVEQAWAAQVDGLKDATLAMLSGPWQIRTPVKPEVAKAVEAFLTNFHGFCSADSTCLLETPDLLCTTPQHPCSSSTTGSSTVPFDETNAPCRTAYAEVYSSQIAHHAELVRGREFLLQNLTTATEISNSARRKRVWAHTGGVVLLIVAILACAVMSTTTVIDKEPSTSCSALEEMGPHGVALNLGFALLGSVSLYFLASYPEATDLQQNVHTTLCLAVLATVARNVHRTNEIAAKARADVNDESAETTATTDPGDVFLLSCVSCVREPGRAFRHVRRRKNELVGLRGQYFVAYVLAMEVLECSMRAWGCYHGAFTHTLNVTLARCLLISLNLVLTPIFVLRGKRGDVFMLDIGLDLFYFTLDVVVALVTGMGQGWAEVVPIAITVLFLASSVKALHEYLVEVAAQTKAENTVGTTSEQRSSLLKSMRDLRAPLDAAEHTGGASAQVVPVGVVDGDVALRSKKITMRRVATGLSIVLGIGLFTWVFAIGTAQGRTCQTELGIPTIWGAVDPKIVFETDQDGGARAGCAYGEVRVLDLSDMDLIELPPDAVLEEFTNLETLKLSGNKVRALALSPLGTFTSFLTRMCPAIHSSRTLPSPSCGC